MTQSINYYIQLSDEISTAIDSMTKEELIYMAFRVLDTYQQHSPFPCKRIYIYNPLKWFKLPNEHLIKLAKGLLDKADDMVV